MLPYSRGWAHMECLPSEVAISIMDQLYVREELRKHWAQLPVGERPAFERKADKIIKIAKHAGIFAALSWVEESEEEVDKVLARAEEHGYGE